MQKFLLAAFVVACVAGCGSKETTVVSGDGGKVTADGAGNMTVTDKDGNKSTLGTSSVTESELGLPFYPGSSALEGRDIKVNADGGQTYLSARTSSDAPSKIVDFYKDKVKEPQTASAEKFGSVNGKLEDGRTVAIMAMAKDSGSTEVQVSVSSVKKN